MSIPQPHFPIHAQLIQPTTSLPSIAFPILPPQVKHQSQYDEPHRNESGEIDAVAFAVVRRVSWDLYPHSTGYEDEGILVRQLELGS